MENIEQRVKKIVAEQLGVNEADVKNESSFVNDLGTEISRSLAFLERYTSASAMAGSSPVVARSQAWQALCRAVLAANEFVYVE